MPTPIGPLLGFALGVLLAWLSPISFESAPSRGLPRSEFIVLLFAALVFGPACAYFIAFEGDWAVAYLIDSRSIPSAVDLLVIAVDASSVVVGFKVARGLARNRALRPLAVMATAPLFTAFVLVLAFRSRLSIEGTYQQVRSDFGTQPVAGGPLGYAILWMSSIIGAGFALSVWLLRAQRTTPAQPSDPQAGLTLQSLEGPFHDRRLAQQTERPR